MVSNMVGKAPAGLPNSRESALRDAIRGCIEAGGGTTLISMTQSKDFQAHRRMASSRKPTDT